MHNARWFALSAVIVLLDQLTKQWALDSLILHIPHKLLGVFNLTLAYNEGAAFSFLADHDGWQRWFLATVSLIASIAIAVWILRLKPEEKWLTAALSLILGGAVGNLIDRVYYGHVVDFLDFHWNHSHFPAFNLADSAITLGAILLFIDMMIPKRKEHD